VGYAKSNAYLRRFSGIPELRVKRFYLDAGIKIARLSPPPF
jgi:hypothetical protein